MLISVSNYDLSISDKAINLLAKNPYKYPRPSEMNPVNVIIPAGENQKEVKEPAVPFAYTITYLYERCMKFLLERMIAELQGNPESPVATEGIKRTIFLYPWQFIALAWARPEAGLITLQRLQEECLPNRSEWSKFYYLEIQEATIKYKDKREKRN